MDKKHTEDCLDANDDASVLWGKCICPKPVTQSAAVKCYEAVAPMRCKREGCGLVIDRPAMRVPFCNALCWSMYQEEKELHLKMAAQTLSMGATHCQCDECYPAAEVRLWA